MRRVRNEDAVARGLAAVVVIGAHHQEPGELAMRAGGRLQRHRGEAADLGEPALQREDHARGRPAPSPGPAADGCRRSPRCGRSPRSPWDCISWCRSRADRSRCRPRNCAATARGNGAPRRAPRAPAVRSRRAHVLRQRRRAAHRAPADRCRDAPARSLHRRSEWCGISWHAFRCDPTSRSCAARRPDGRSRRGC